MFSDEFIFPFRDNPALPAYLRAGGVLLPSMRAGRRLHVLLYPEPQEWHPVPKEEGHPGHTAHRTEDFQVRQPYQLSFQR